MRSNASTPRICRRPLQDDKSTHFTLGSGEGAVGRESSRQSAHIQGEEVAERAAAVRDGEGVGLLLRQDTEVREGVDAIDREAHEAEDRDKCVPDSGVQSAVLSLVTGQQDVRRRLGDKGNHVEQDVEHEYNRESSQKLGPHPRAPSRSAGGGAFEGAEDDVYAMDSSPGDDNFRGVQLGGIQLWSRPSVRQLHVCPFGRDGGTAPSKGSESQGTESQRLLLAVDPAAHLERCLHPCREECAALSGVVQSVGATNESHGGEVATDELETDPRGTRPSAAYELIVIRARGIGCFKRGAEEGCAAPCGHIRGRGDRRGREAGENARDVGEVGRVCPRVGGMARGGSRASRRPSCDMGARVERAIYGGVRAVEGEQGSSSSSSDGGGQQLKQPRSKSTGWQRCRKESCCRVREERDDALKRLAALRLELQGLRTGLRLGGEARGWRAQLVEVERILQQERVEHDASKRQRNAFANLLKVAEKELLESRGEVVHLQSEISLLRRRQLRRAKVEFKQASGKRQLYELKRRLKQVSMLKEAAEVTASAAESRAVVLQSQMRAAKMHEERAKRQLQDAEQFAASAEKAALQARAQLIVEEAAARNAEKAVNQAQWEAILAERRAERAKEKAQKLKDRLEELVPPTRGRTVDEWMALSRDAQRKAAQREREHLLSFFGSHHWRIVDVAHVLAELGWVKEIFATRPFFDEHFYAVKRLMACLEKEHYGKTLGLFLHYELQMPLAKILNVTQAACKQYNRHVDRYEPKVLMFHKWLKHERVHVPRIAPPSSVMTPLIRSIEKELHVDAAEDGRLAFKSFVQVVVEVLTQDTGKLSMPPISAFVGAHKLALPIVVSLDATGFGSLQFNTISARNPYMSASAQQLRTFGVGNCSDNREGSIRLLGPNLETINRMLRLKNEALEGDRCIPISLGEGSDEVLIRPDVLVVQDVSALRHCEHLANSGWCCCSRDFALRAIPGPKPENVEELHTFLLQCHSPTRLERFVLSHSPLPGEKQPRPCTMPGCSFAHDEGTAMEELAGLLAEEERLCKDTTKAGKATFSKWRMTHAKTHLNVQPGQYGRPMFEHDMDDQLLDSLHYAELGLPKIPWKHGVLNHCSDDARQKISDKLAEWKHPLDCRRKEDGRQRTQKWYTGERWVTFCAGERGSPGGPIAIATLMLIVAEDLQLSFGLSAKDVAEEATAEPQRVSAASRGAAGGRASGRGRGRSGRGRAAFTTRAQLTYSHQEEAPPETQLNKEPEEPTHLQHTPSSMEERANQEDLAIVRELYGSRAQTIINTLLAFDAYFAWYYPLKKSIPFLAPMPEREVHALRCCRSAIDMYEMFERVSIRNHQSFLPHGAVYKVPRDILRVGDVHAVNLSPLELHNAETKRTAQAAASRRLTTSSSGETRRPMRGSQQGPEQLVPTTGYSTSMALSTLKKLLGQRYLRRGDGIIATPESRRKERLFGEHGTGRSSRLCTNVKLEKLRGSRYEPAEDTCLTAFVRLLAVISTPDDTPPVVGVLDTRDAPLRADTNRLGSGVNASCE